LVRTPGHSSTQLALRCRQGLPKLAYAFTVAEKNGEQFAAELDVLSALIRARIIEAKFVAG
jgi:hypothetical protein